MKIRAIGFMLALAAMGIWQAQKAQSAELALEAPVPWGSGPTIQTPPSSPPSGWNRGANPRDSRARADMVSGANPTHVLGTDFLGTENAQSSHTPPGHSPEKPSGIRGTYASSPQAAYSPASTPGRACAPGGGCRSTGQWACGGVWQAPLIRPPEGCTGCPGWRMPLLARPCPYPLGWVPPLRSTAPAPCANCVGAVPTCRSGNGNPRSGHSPCIRHRGYSGDLYLWTIVLPR